MDCKSQVDFSIKKCETRVVWHVALLLQVQFLRPRVGLFTIEVIQFSSRPYISIGMTSFWVPLMGTGVTKTEAGLGYDNGLREDCHRTRILMAG